MVSHENGAICLSFLDSFQPGKLKLSFNLGAIDHPIFGKSENLSGDFQLFHTKGSLPISNYFGFSKEEQAKILDDAVKRLGHLHEELDTDDIRKRFQVAIITTALCCPRVDAHTRGFRIVCDVLIVAFHDDDIFEDHPLLDDINFTYRKLDEINKHWRLHVKESDTNQENKFRQEYIDRHLKMIPEIGPSVRAGESIEAAFIEEYPEGLPESVNYLLTELCRFGESHIFKYQGTGEPLTFSEKGLRSIREYNAGLGVFLGVYTIVQHHEVPHNIRNSLLFGMLLTCVREFGALVNDIIGLWKDIRDEVPNKNIILRREIREGISIEQSFKETLGSLRDTISDMVIVIRRLEEAFPEEKDLAGFIECCKDTCDGQTLAYLVSSQLKGGRYGSICMKIVPDEVE